MKDHENNDSSEYERFSAGISDSVTPGMMEKMLKVTGDLVAAAHDQSGTEPKIGRTYFVWSADVKDISMASHHGVGFAEIGTDRISVRAFHDSKDPENKKRFVDGVTTLFHSMIEDPSCKRGEDAFGVDMPIAFGCCEMSSVVRDARALFAALSDDEIANSMNVTRRFWPGVPDVDFTEPDISELREQMSGSASFVGEFIKNVAKAHEEDGADLPAPFSDPKVGFASRMSVGAMSVGMLRGSVLYPLSPDGEIDRSSPDFMCEGTDPETGKRSVCSYMPGVDEMFPVFVEALEAYTKAAIVALRESMGEGWKND